MTDTPDTITVTLSVERKQSKVDSWIETIVNIAIGYVISWSAWKWVIGPLTGVHTNDRTNTAIVSLFTVTSIARQYVIRRTFNGRPIWATLKALRK